MANRIPSLILVEAPLTPLWCNHCQTEKYSSTSINGNLIVLEPTAKPIGATKIIIPYNKNARTFQVFNPESLHQCESK